MSRIHFVEWAIKSTPIWISKIQIYKINPPKKYAKNTIYIHWVCWCWWFLYFFVPNPMDWNRSQKVSKADQFWCVSSGPRCRSTSQAAETGDQCFRRGLARKWSIGNGCKRWQLVGERNFAKGIDVKLSGFHGVSNMGKPQFSRFRNSLDDFCILLWDF